MFADNIPTSSAAPAKIIALALPPRSRLFSLDRRVTAAGVVSMFVDETLPEAYVPVVAALASAEWSAEAALRLREWPVLLPDDPGWSALDNAAMLAALNEASDWARQWADVFQRALEMQVEQH